MTRYLRPVFLAGGLALLAACGRTVDTTQPLAFVPADTVYVYANSDANRTPGAREALLRALWKPYFAELSARLDRYDAGSKAAPEKPRSPALTWARSVVAELRDRDTRESLREIGLDLTARGALYAVGLAPVLRIELADVGAFRAFVARLEKSTGDTLPVLRIGEQDYWRIGADDDAVRVAAAVEGRHLVVTLLPKEASDATLKALLGVERPAANLLAAETLAQLGKERGYRDGGAGYVDVVRLAARLAKEYTGSDAEFARALGVPERALDATCQAEIAALASGLPRITFGSSVAEAQRGALRVDVDVKPELRTQLAALAQPVPGMAAQDPAMVDAVLALPLLKARDFALAQANAVAAKPFSCTPLAGLNVLFSDLRTRIDKTVPPPLSDVLGLRVTIEKMGLDARGLPDAQQSAARVLEATTNPLLVAGMAQMVLPAMKDVRLAADGKPVAVPAAGLPIAGLTLHAAASDKALALAAGSGGDAALPPYLAAPAGDGRTLLRLRLGGTLFSFYATALDHIAGRGPAADEERTRRQALYTAYAKIIDHVELRVALSADGVRIEQEVALGP